MASEERLLALELMIAKLLRYGVVLAGIMLFVGWMSQLSLTANPFAEFATYHREPMLDAIRGAWLNHSYGIVTGYAGLITLILLPFLRVIMTALLFFKQREYVLAGVASFVCLALVTSVLLGFDI